MSSAGTGLSGSVAFATIVTAVIARNTEEITRPVSLQPNDVIRPISENNV